MKLIEIGEEVLTASASEMKLKVEENHKYQLLVDTYDKTTWNVNLLGSRGAEHELPTSTTCVRQKY